MKTFQIKVYMIEGGRYFLVTATYLSYISHLLSSWFVSVKTSCFWCCKENGNSTCLPYLEGTSTINLPEGMPCVQGFCKEVSSSSTFIKGVRIQEENLGRTHCGIDI